MRITNIIVCLILVCYISCKETVQKDKPVLQVIASPSGENSALPFLFSNGEKLVMSWVTTKNDSLTQLQYSEFTKGKWQPAQYIIEGDDWFVNWADFPAIAVNNSNLVSHVLKKSSAGTYSYDVKLNLLPSGEKIWKTNGTVHTDETSTEHGFVSLLPYKDGFFITWLDGRNTGEDENGNRGAMTIRAAEVSVTGEITNEYELDNRACDCCQTTAAITKNGPVVMYRDRSEDEIRDMSIVRWENDKWTAPKTVYADNWKIKGCPVNGPKSAVLDNTLVMAWFSAVDKQPKVQLIFSDDSGATFDEAIPVSVQNAMGRVDVLLLDDKTAIVSWMETHGTVAQLKAMRVHRDGNKGEQHVITEMDASRKSGFPQMEKYLDKIYFAWTDYSSEKTRVKTAVISSDGF